MPTTTYEEITASVRGIANRTDSAGAGVTDMSAEEDRLVNLLSAGWVTTDAFKVQPSAGMTVQVGSGAAKADVFAVVGTTEGQGTYLVRLATPKTVTVPAADAAQPRIDRVYLVVADQAYDAGTLSLPRILYRRGDAGAGAPSAPTEKAQALLAEITVPAGATTIAAGDIADQRATSRFLGGVAWHGDNDGPGSGLDADLLDGFQGAAFARLAAANTFTAAQVIDGFGIRPFLAANSITSAALPSAWPDGLVTMILNTGLADGYPVDLATLLSVRESGSRLFQLLVERTTGVMWIRSSLDSSTWGSWVRSTSGLLRSSVTDVTMWRATGLLPGQGENLAAALTSVGFNDASTKRIVPDDLYGATKVQIAATLYCEDLGGAGSLNVTVSVRNSANTAEVLATVTTTVNAIGGKAVKSTWGTIPAWFDGASDIVLEVFTSGGNGAADFYFPDVSLRFSGDAPA